MSDPEAPSPTPLPKKSPIFVQVPSKPVLQPQRTLSPQNPPAIHHISRPSVVSVEIHIFLCYRDLYSSFTSLTTDLSLTSPVLIVASGVFNIPVEVLWAQMYYIWKA
jgi:hypothetical protein